MNNYGSAAGDRYSSLWSWSRIWFFSVHVPGISILCTILFLRVLFICLGLATTSRIQQEHSPEELKQMEKTLATEKVLFEAERKKYLAMIKDQTPKELGETAEFTLNYAVVFASQPKLLQGSVDKFVKAYTEFNCMECFQKKKIIGYFFSAGWCKVAQELITYVWLHMLSAHPPN